MVANLGEFLRLGQRVKIPGAVGSGGILKQAQPKKSGQRATFQGKIRVVQKFRQGRHLTAARTCFKVRCRLPYSGQKRSQFLQTHL
jgi:hypothetical protein